MNFVWKILSEKFSKLANSRRKHCRPWRIRSYVNTRRRWLDESSHVWHNCEEIIVSCFWLVTVSWEQFLISEWSFTWINLYLNIGIYIIKKYSVYVLLFTYQCCALLWKFAFIEILEFKHGPIKTFDQQSRNHFVKPVCYELITRYMK